MNVVSFFHQPGNCAEATSLHLRTATAFCDVRHCVAPLAFATPMVCHCVALIGLEYVMMTAYVHSSRFMSDCVLAFYAFCFIDGYSMRPLFCCSSSQSCCSCSWFCLMCALIVFVSLCIRSTGQHGCWNSVCLAFVVAGLQNSLSKFAMCCGCGLCVVAMFSVALPDSFAGVCLSYDFHGIRFI